MPMSMTALLKFLETIVIALIAIFAPAKQMVLTAFALILIDLITGIWAAKKRGDNITSAGFKRTVVKICVYEIAILLAFLAERYLILDVIPVAKIVSSFVGITELKSVLENINEIGGGDLLTTVLKKLNGPNE